MNVLNLAKRNVGSFANKHPTIVVAGGGIAFGVAVASIFWYIYGDKKRRNKFKQIINNNAALIIASTNVALFASTAATQENRKQTVKRLLLVGLSVNILIFSFIVKQIYNKIFKKQKAKNKIYPSVKKDGSIYIQNPLILLIGISTYNAEKCSQFKIQPTLEGVEADIFNLEKLFKETYKYQHVYTIQDYIDNDDEYSAHHDIWAATDKIIQSFCQHYSNRETIKALNRKNKNKGDIIDSLIVYYSGHGCENDWIYCSNGELLSLYEIKNYFNEAKCIQFKKRPKLFYADCCREPIFDRFTTKQNRDIKSRGGAQDTFNSKEQVTHDSTRMYTFYATSNLKRTEEHSEDGGYMTNCFVRHLEETRNNNNNTLNELAQKMKLHLLNNNGHPGEERNCLLNDNIKFIPCT